MTDAGKGLVDAASRADAGPGAPGWLDDFFSLPRWEKLIRIARRIGARSHSEAAEAVAAALYDVARNADHVQDPLGYTRTAIAHHLPRERRHFERPRELAGRGGGTHDVVDDPGLAVLEDIDWVLSVLRTLSPKQQQVMALYYDGYSVAEIADRVGDAPGNVGSNLHLARRTLMNHQEVAQLHRSTASQSTALDPTSPREEHR